MIKRIALLILLASTLFGAKNSLIGIEGGYTTSINADNGSYRKDAKLGSVGLKIGAEGESYRVFVSTRYLKGTNYDYGYTYGIELQYLLRLTNNFNIFLGGNYGHITLKPSNTSSLGTIYYGADTGVNFNLSENFDFELGVRGIKLREHLTYDHMLSGYGSIIYRFHLN